MLVEAKTATILEEDEKALEMEILTTFLLGIPKIVYDNIVAAGIEGKTKIHEGQLPSEQIELAASKAVNPSTVLQVNEEAAAVTDKAIQALEDKDSALTGTTKRKKRPTKTPTKSKPAFTSRPRGTWKKGETTTRKQWGPAKNTGQEGVKCFICNSRSHLYAACQQN